MTQRPVSAEDLFTLQWPANPKLSPDGRHVVYEQTVVHRQRDDYVTQLMLAEVHGSFRRVLTNSATRNMCPVWSPDGKTIAFLSNQAFGLQIWLLSPDTGELRRLSCVRYGVSSIVWSPDGQTIYGLVPVAKNEGVQVFSANLTAQEADEEISREHRAWQDGPKHYHWQYYKDDGVGFQQERKQQLVAFDTDTGECRQITNGDYDVAEPAVSPDGRYICFVSYQSEREHPLFGGQLYRVPAAGGDVELLVGDLPVMHPAYSPDGNVLAFISDHSRYRQLYVIPANGGEASCISADFADSINDNCYTDILFKQYPQLPQWSKDSRFVYVLSSWQGCTEIVRFPQDGTGSQAMAVVGGERVISTFSFDGDDTFAISYLTPLHPEKIAVTKMSCGNPRERKRRKLTDPLAPEEHLLFPDTETRLDDCNDELMSELAVSQPEMFSYRSEDGWQIQGFVLKPAHVVPGQKYPVVLDIHGGPQAFYGFAYFHQFQLLAALGYAVVYTNPRGSLGFGMEFTHAVHGHYGDKDMADILHGLDEALCRYDFLDPNRVIVTGLSYGGFMVNWLVAHTDRFIAAISEGSVSNWISMYGTSDICPAFMDIQFVGKTDGETLWKHSPLAYAENVKTPLLLIHAENDLRCPIEQSEQFYSYIKRHGGAVEFFRIPHSSHVLLQNGKPSLRMARLTKMVEFINAAVTKNEK